ncbi:molybdenum ABC transporter ATP-binding protein [Pleomorphomonas carboxyditropha]|uniref:Molybdenum ABC transporter ATP-binding protein n=1 Tax=Pleomorphomonas carboxyditropha TaxID=2023338 RepID=A0A2G9WSH9_9HYPH|nr:molybdenum ABC transporter ATP-binding protein [Pleomorphomonas carboxyditropha]PIO97671.1 molybdenum ABC transporter ATP-binding protein [Pleomorphomonas carboxyditropha]
MADSGTGITANFKLGLSSFDLDVRFELPARGVTAFFGHSGSGKTTILRCVAGLTRAPTAFLRFGDSVWQDEERGLFVPTHRRPIGVVFQEASLFPHLSVLGNLCYGMKRAGLKAADADFDATVGLLGIESLLLRSPAKLSGGERQRVAIARALLRRPRLLLMDEPLAALDLKRKSEILPYLERLHDELDIPILYVSHSPDEVARLADTVVLLQNGRIVAQGPVWETMGRLDLVPFFSEDAAVVIPMVVGEHESDGLTRLDFAGGHLLVGKRQEIVGQRVRVRIQASDVSISLTHHADMSIQNILMAKVLQIADAAEPGHALVELRIAEQTQFIARVTKRSVERLGLRPQALVWAQVKAVAIMGNS